MKPVPVADAAVAAIVTDPAIDTSAVSTGIVRRRGTGRLLAWSALGPVATVSAIIFIGLALVAIFAPLIAPTSPTGVDPLNVFAPSSAQHLLGTDDTGRDILSRLIYGARPSLAGPLLVVLLSSTVGTALGVAAAWYRGIADAVLSRVFDLLFAFPGIVLALLAATLFGPGFIAPVLALSIAYLPLVARLMRAAAMKERSLPYVEALQIQGASPWRITMRHLLPNILPLLVVQATIGFGYALLDLAAISFLGLGLQPPTADWGVMIADGKPSILDGNPQQSLYAAAVDVIAVVAVNLVGERLATRFGVAGTS